MNQKLLVLDDEKDLLDSYRMILSPQAAVPKIVSSRGAKNPGVAPTPMFAFDVTYVSNGTEALNYLSRCLNEGNPVVGGFFDVKLGPGIDGIETIRQAKSMDPDLLCVIVTAYQDRDIQEIRHIFGEDYADHWDFLAKPFASSEILQKAFNLVATWNRKNKEKELLRELKSRQEQEELIQELLDDILHKIRGKADYALQNSPQDGPVKLAVKNILSTIDEADRILRNVLALVKAGEKKQEKQTPKAA